MNEEKRKLYQTQNIFQLLVVNSDDRGCNQPWSAETHFLSQLQEILPIERSTKALTCQDKLYCHILVIVGELLSQ